MTSDLKKQTRRTPAAYFHPLLIGAYSSVAYLAANMLQLNPIEALRTIVFALVFGGIIFLIISVMIKNHSKAAILASATLFLFSLYGHAYNLLEDNSFLGHHRYLLALWAILWIVILVLVLRTRKILTWLNIFLNYFSAVLVLIPCAMIALNLLNKPVAKAPLNSAIDQAHPPARQSDSAPPDVYYIILDAYARADILEQYYGFDNSEFIEALQQRGFYVADCSLSNYNQTIASLSSALNMDYLDGFAAPLMKQQTNYYRLGAAVKHSKARELFEGMGYHFVSFETSYWWMDISDADTYISLDPSPWHKLTNFRTLSVYEKDFLNTTAYLAINELLLSSDRNAPPGGFGAYRQHYDMIRNNFDQLEQLPRIEEPIFVYAHILAPHYPYVTAPDGSFQYEEADEPGYLDNMHFVNARLLKGIDALLANSDTPPVIILQGDHGLDFEVRNANLNAYYFPETSNEMLYPTITPVNTFRLVFNTYFGAQYPLLPDTAWFASYQNPFVFNVYEDDCSAAGQ